ncbi:MAG: hypothetical protein HYX24_01070 [Candidatus Aenigmarchaeota archaeon]|nr:hypothetical protein [Candidatus Aenigmarchaeota archaeon]
MRPPRLLVIAAFTMLILANAALSDSPKQSILLVEDAHFYPGGNVEYKNSELEKYYAWAIQGNGYSFDKCVVSANDGDGPGYSTQTSSCTKLMKDYDIVIWFTAFDPGIGYSYPTLTDTDISNLQAYLNSGGKLFLTGQDIGFDIGNSKPDFYHDYLHATYKTDDSNSYYVKDASSGLDPIGDGFTIGIYDDYGIDYPDVIDKKDSFSFRVFKYCTSICSSKFAGVRAKTATHKNVYFGFNFERITGSQDNQTRTSLMRQILGYLASPDAKGAMLYPNVTNSTAVLNVTCNDTQRYSYVTAAEYFVDAIGSSGSGNSLGAKDGTFDTATEVANATINTSSISEGSHTIAVHCKDADGFWGKFDNVTLTVDRTAPAAPFITIENDGPYTTKEKPLLNIIDASGGSNTPNYMRFSCDNASWTPWVSWNTSHTDFNFTSADYGCQNADGTKTVFVQARDTAGNLQGLTRKDDTNITLDRQPPYIASISKANNSFIASSTNLTIVLNDSLSGIPGSGHTFDNGNGTRASFLSGAAFSPGYAGEGNRTLNLTIMDNAGNQNSTVYFFAVDNTAPQIALTAPANGSYINFSGKIVIDITEGFSGIAASWFDNGNGTNTSFSDNVSFNPGYSTEGSRILRVYANDSAGNLNSTVLAFTADNSSPVFNSVSPANASNITGSTPITVFFADSISAASAVADNGNGTNVSITSNVSFIPGFTGEGLKNLTAYLNDSVGNTNYTRLFYTADLTPPNTTDNYSSSQWATANQPVGLTCTDNVTACSTTLYCTHRSTEPECTPSAIGAVAAAICSQNDECQIYVRYRSNDTVGNAEATKNTSLIMIDRKGPSIVFITPLDGSNRSGAIDIRANITDGGAGVINATYSILNASNTSQTIASGNLTYPAWNSTFNSNQYNTETFILMINSTDNVSNTANRNITFIVDNQRPSAIILFPRDKIVRSNFSLDMRGSAISGRILTECSYYIYNSTSTVNYTVTGASSSACSYTNTIDIQTLADGNYSLNFTAIDNISLSSTDRGWVYIDRQNPSVSITSPGNASTQTGTINVSFSASDSVRLSSCSWSLIQSGTTGPFNISCTANISFSTQLCTDTNKSNCTIQLSAADEAGNSNTSSIWLSIDNTRPSVSITSPSANSWQPHTFNISFSAVDTSGLQCMFRIAGSSDSGWLTMPCSQPFIANISYCQTEGTARCGISVQANDSVGFSGTADRNFSIDITKPYLTSLSPANGSRITSSGMITAAFSDSISGLAAVLFDNGNGTNISFSSGAAFGPGFAGNGLRNITMYATDVAGNTNSTYAAYTLDNTPPSLGNLSLNITDAVFSDYRVHPFEKIKIRANISDSSGISYAIVEINYSGQRRNFSMLQDADVAGNFSLIFPNANSTGRYAITMLSANDTVGNIAGLSEPQINRSFLVINTTLAATINSSKSIDSAGTGSVLLAIDFNRSMANRSFSVFQPASFSNISQYSCTSACSLSMSDSQLSAIPLTAVSAINISSTVNAAAQPQDANSTWTARAGETNISDYIAILSPLLNITTALCDGSQTCVINQSVYFNLSITVRNEAGNGRSGRASLVNVSFSSEAGGNYTVINDMPSNSSRTASWNISVGSAGTYNFTVMAREGFSGMSNASGSKNVTIIDAEQPMITLAEISASTININESVNITLFATDNVNVTAAWVMVNDSSNLTNMSLALYSGSYSSGTWLLLFNQTQEKRNYTILAEYANDSRGNIGYLNTTLQLEVRQLDFNISLSGQATTVNTTLTLQANITGNASAIQSVQALIAKPGNVTETIDLPRVAGSSLQYYGEYRNISRSGNYTVSAVATMRFVAIRNSTFSVPLGNISVELSDGNQTRVDIPVGLAANLSVLLTPSNGDLLGILAYAAASGVINLTENLKDAGNVSFEGVKPRKISFAVNGTAIGQAYVNFTVNSSYHQAANRSILVSVTSPDIQKPQINSVSAAYSIRNLYEANAISVNATDNSVIQAVIISVAHPSGARQNYSASQVSNGLYSLDFSNINETGNFSLSAFAVDISGNINSSSGHSFNATDNYTVNVTLPYTSYNKGENVSITVAVKNANNENVTGFNLSLTLQKSSANVSLSNGSAQSSAFYRIEFSDMPDSSSGNNATYTAYANVSRNGNRGLATAAFEVYKSLIAQIISPASGEVVSTSQPMTVRVRVLNIRQEPSTDASVLAQCQTGKCNNQFVLLSKESEGIYSNNQSLQPIDFVQAFALTVTASDSFRNSASDVVAPSTMQSSSSSGSSSAVVGGGGTAAGGAGGKNLSKEEEPCKSDKDCEGGLECDLSLSVCIKIKKGEEKIAGFELLLDQNVLEIQQGKDAVISGKIRNTENQQLDVEIEVKSDCCNFLHEKELKIQAIKGTEKAVQINVHVPLTDQAGQYVALLAVKNKGINAEKTGSVFIRVLSNRLVETLRNKYPKALRELRTTTEDLEKVGIDVENLKRRIGNIELALKEAENAIFLDDIQSLERILGAAEDEFILASLESIGLRFLKFVYSNLNLLVAIIVIVSFSSYFAMTFAIPYMRLRKNLLNLMKEENAIVTSRKSAEVQYFKRKIDEKTFRGIMVKEQDRLLTIRAKTAEARQEIDNLLGTAFSLRSLAGMQKRAGPKKQAMPAKGIQTSKLSGSQTKQTQIQIARQSLFGLGKLFASRGVSKEMPKQTAGIKGRLEEVEKAIHTTYGVERNELEQQYRFAKEFAGKGLGVMASYHLERCEEILKRAKRM